MLQIFSHTLILVYLHLFKLENSQKSISCEISKVSWFHLGQNWHKKMHVSEHFWAAARNRECWTVPLKKKKKKVFWKVTKIFNL